MVFFVIVLVLNGMVLVLEENIGTSSIFKAAFRGSSFLIMEIELNKFERFEYEHEYEYRCAEYEKTELRPTNTPGDPRALIGSKAIALGMQILIDCIEFVFKIIERLNCFAASSAVSCCQIRR